jgi:hypothetical protein
MAGKTVETGFFGLVLIGALVVGAGIVAVAAAALWLILWLVVRHPFCTAAAAATVASFVEGGTAAVVVLWAAVAAATLAWRAAWRESFDRRVLWRWRRTFVYGWRWRRALAACDLDGTTRGGTGLRLLPRLGSVRSSGLTDVVSVRPLADQDARCFAARSDDLARVLGAASCDARADVTGAIHLELRRRPWVSRRSLVEDAGPIDLRRALPGPPVRPARCSHGAHRRVQAAA